MSNSWYSDAVHWATHEGIINGYNNGKFGPNDPVTREQIAVILWRYAKYAGYEMSTGKTMNMFSFDDASDISEFAIAPRTQINDQLIASYYYDDASNAEMNTALISSYEGENQKLDDFRSEVLGFGDDADYYALWMYFWDELLGEKAPDRYVT